MASADKKGARREIEADALAEYKTVFKSVLDNRPSGTRQRLATALGKNRSFISQISNPAYSVPVPAQHIERIFEVCHFAPNERKRFLAAYGRAHQRRLRLVQTQAPTRQLTLTITDLGDSRRNAVVDRMIEEMAQRIIRLAEEID